ncbi:cytochrome c-type biogenesis protein CcmH [Alginatibacterium sediminis]|uniref:Cytochrome c-type biogenesis protein n=2 Tax=Alginatibacterium sediminis TaxID=2164068 RepID=A0A420EIQ4_9ALTE|nr:cytochrome c-type biogenesis protein CcmH [Alginatibacterium sediminis]
MNARKRGVLLLLSSFVLTLSLAAMNQAFAAIDVYEFSSEQQEDEFRELIKELRCPKCQNNNISDSNAPLAQDLRDKTYEMIVEGQSKQQILDYMVARYGNFVRYDPPLTPAVLMLWIIPLSCIALGFVLVWRRSGSKAKTDELSEAERQRLAKIIEEEKSQS